MSSGCLNQADVVLLKMMAVSVVVLLVMMAVSVVLLLVMMVVSVVVLPHRQVWCPQVV